jgi:hypothetical protein
MYYIYHIPTFKQKDGSIGKIGTSIDPKLRVKKQKYIDYEILFVSANKEEASNKEIELQKQYGYRVDKTPYYVTIKMATKKSCSKGGKKHVESGHLTKLQQKCRKTVLQYTKSVEFIKEWESAAAAGNALGTNNSHITTCCKGNRKSAGGYIWKYKK